MKYEMIFGDEKLFDGVGRIYCGFFVSIACNYML